MSQRKRQRSQEEQDPDLISDSEDVTINPQKKPRREVNGKETNAQARRSLFVRSLAATATTETLTTLFSENYPLKHATVVIDTATKKCKGYGFVTFADAGDAEKAMNEFNGKSFLGRKMRVEIAQPRVREVAATAAPGEKSKSKSKSSISAEVAALRKAREEKLAEDRKPPKLIIRNLPWSIKTPEQLEDIFKKYGKVKHSTLPKKNTDTQAGFGFVVMRGRKNAEKALAAINGLEIDGRTLAVDWAVEKDVWDKQQEASSENSNDEGENEKKASDSKPKKSTEDNEDDDVANFMRNFGEQLESEPEDSEEEGGAKLDGNDNESENWTSDNEEEAEEDNEESDIDSVDGPKRDKVFITDNSSTLFIRNLPYTVFDSELKDHFTQFGPVRYARVVMDRAEGRPRGTAFVCFYNVDDAEFCVKAAPRHELTGANATTQGKKGPENSIMLKNSLLQDPTKDPNGKYTLQGRVLQVTRAVEKDQATKLTEAGHTHRDSRDRDKRQLYLLSEGTVAAGTPLHEMLAPSEIKIREESAMQRKKLIQNNPSLHLSLTRLSIRNLPRNLDSKALKALSREAVVGFATDVRAGLRTQLSREEEARGGSEMREAEQQRKSKGKGIVKQAKIVFESREGSKVTEALGAGRSRGYGFVEYSSHRWALMGLRWLNGHMVESSSGKKQRLIVEFAIENAQVVARRKEKEEKARARSKQTMEEREKAEKEQAEEAELPTPKKAKKVLRKDTIMARTRRGMKDKGGKIGLGKGGKEEATWKKFKDQPSRKDLPSKARDRAAAAATGRSGQGADEKGPRRAQIIQRKRMMRKQRKGGN